MPGSAAVLATLREASRAGTSHQRELGEAVGALMHTVASLDPITTLAAQAKLLAYDSMTAERVNDIVRAAEAHAVARHIRLVDVLDWACDRLTDGWSPPDVCKLLAMSDESRAWYVLAYKVAGQQRVTNRSLYTLRRLYWGRLPRVSALGEPL